MCWGDLKGGVVNLAVSACVSRATTKKVVKFLEEEQFTPDKILATPTSLAAALASTRTLHVRKYSLYIYKTESHTRLKQNKMHI